MHPPDRFCEERSPLGSFSGWYFFPAKSAMYKYYYFAVERFEEVAQQGGARTKRVPVTQFSTTVFASAEEAYDAGKAFACSHLGERFKICGFDKRLKLDEKKHCVGYIEGPINCLVVMYDPYEIFPEDFVNVELSVEQAIDTCIKVYEYETETDALEAYANKHCADSVLCCKADVAEAVEKFASEFRGARKEAVLNSYCPF